MIPEDLVRAEEQKEYQEMLREEYIRQVLEDGKVVVVPGPNELQIDIDSDEDLARMASSMDILQTNYPNLVIAWDHRVSASGAPHRHVTVVLSRDVRDAEERILLQALLGSDLKREVLSLIRYWKGDSMPTLFVEEGEDIEGGSHL